MSAGNVALCMRVYNSHHFSVKKCNGCGVKRSPRYNYAMGVGLKEAPGIIMQWVWG